MTAIDDAMKGDAFPVVASVVLAYRNVLTRPRRLFRLAALPAAVCLALAGAYLLSPWRDHPLGVLSFFLLLMPLSYVALAGTRSSISDERPQFLLRRPWVAAYLKTLACYCFWILCLYSGPALLILVAAILVRVVTGDGDALSTFLSFMPMTWLCLAIVSVIPFGRLFLALPLIATARPASPRAAWREGSGHGFRLGGAALLLSLTFLFLAIFCSFILSEALLALLGPTLMDVAVGDTYFLRDQIQFLVVFGITVPLGGVIGTVLFAELLTIAFRGITGWRGTQQEVLAAFD